MRNYSQETGDTRIFGNTRSTRSTIHSQALLVKTEVNTTRHGCEAPEFIPAVLEWQKLTKLRGIMRISKVACTWSEVRRSRTIDTFRTNDTRIFRRVSTN